MASLVSPGLAQSLRNGWPTAWLVDIDWPVTPVRLWDGLGTLKWGDKTFTGIRNVGRVIGVGGSKQIKVREVTLELKGVGQDAQEFLEPTIRNRLIQIWLAGFDKNGKRINGDPDLAVEGKADRREVFVDESHKAGIRLIVSEPTYIVERAQFLRYTPEWIKATYGDNIAGLDLLSRIELERIPWTKS